MIYYDEYKIHEMNKIMEDLLLCKVKYVTQISEKTFK